ncbi:hypothetical protein UT300007_02160 [Clostridium sp. CTA-7]
MKKIILIGGGGHCKSVIDSIKKSNEYEIVGIIDTCEKIGMKISSIPIIGDDNDLINIYKSGVKHAFITIGSIGNCSLRKKIYDNIISIGYSVPSIIDNYSILADNVVIDSGCYIGKGAIINSDCKVGKMSIINTAAVVEHECKIGEYVHIGPGSVLSGNITIGNYTHIGIGSSIIQGISIGEECLIGAGSVVVSNVISNKKAYGVPCKEVGKWKSIFL